MKKVQSLCLFNPPSPWLISDQALAPLGILYLANFVRKHGVDVSLIDLSGDKFNDRLEIPDADLYGVGFVSPQYVYAKNILEQIKKKNPDAQVIAGGVHATSLPDKVLDAGFDAVVCGEGEQAINKILTNGLEQKVYGLDYVSDLNSLPGPAWDLINVGAYASNIDVMDYMSSGQSQEREINIMGTRGCTGVCAYCTQYKGPLRWRTPENIMTEITHLKEEYGINRISFCDDNLVVNKPWFKKLLEGLKEDSVKWHCLGRADQVNQEICDLMFDSGCMGIDFGVETGAQRMLDIIKKRTTVEKQEWGLRVAYESGLRVRAQIMVGLPRETEDDIQQTIAFIGRNNPYITKWGVHVFVPFPSCEIWDYPERFQYPIDKNTDFQGYQTIGKPGEWAYQPSKDSETIHNRRQRILDFIAEKNIFYG
jgi:radical SAM superfamily enzyme YgiQ (UPF0313 family)